jgi:sugar phosphate isomerase/epimerase
MKIGICTHSFRFLCRPEAAASVDIPCPGSFEGLIDLAARYGLGIAEAPLRADLPADEATRLRERAAAAGIRLVPDSGRVSDAPLEALIPLAAALGSRSLRLTLSGILEGDRRQIGRAGWEELLAAAARRLREVRPLAEAHDVALAIENHQDADSDDLLWLCETVGGDHIGVNLDTGNPLAVGEGPVEFAERIAPVLKNVHLKDYRMHRTASGYRLARCPLGDGVVDFPALSSLFADQAPAATCSIELGATQARHIRVLEDSFWEHFRPRAIARFLPALRLLQMHGLPEGDEWRTPHEREAPAAECCAYELAEFERSVAYLDQAFRRSGVQRKLTSEPERLNA